jgi:hypothetical protein
MILSHRDREDRCLPQFLDTLHFPPLFSATLSVEFIANIICRTSDVGWELRKRVVRASGVICDKSIT